MKDNLIFDTKKAQEFFLHKLSFLMSPYELKEQIKDNIQKLNIVDVREYDDYIAGHIPFAIHIPINSLEEHFTMLEKENINIIYTYNQFCKRSIKAAYHIAKKGFPVVVLMGGFSIWQKLGFDVVETDSQQDS